MQLICNNRDTCYEKTICIFPPFHLTHSLRCLELNGDPSLRRRHMLLRKRIQRQIRKIGQANVWKTKYGLNIMPDEFNAPLDEIVIEPRKPEVDDEKENLRTQVGDLRRRLEKMEEELGKTTEERDRERENAVQLGERGEFLCHHINALESEVLEKNGKNDALKESNYELLRQQEKANKPLGRKMFAELGKDAISKTRTSYQETFVDPINQYGERRGMVVEKIVLREKESGQQLEVNAEKAHKYGELNEDERQRVKIASRWKDKERISDRGQSSLSHVGTLPAASHVKAYEKELNAKLGEIQSVCCCCCCYFRCCCCS